MGTKVRGIEVGNRIGEASKFRIYLGTTAENQQVIVKVAKTFEDGDILAEEAGKFNIIRAFNSDIAALEEQEGRQNSHYDWLFANLLSSFMEASQGDRRINIFTIPDTELSKLVPLKKLSTDTEIDSRSSVWILGRFLKMYSFFELLAASGDNPVKSYPLFSPSDYLIGPEHHRLVYYNFSGDMADVVAFDFVKAVAKFILEWAALDSNSEDQEYLKLLEDFAKDGRSSFEEAHADLYNLVERLWGRKYHPFTYRERGTLIWKNMKED